MAPRCSDRRIAGRSSHTSMPKSNIRDGVFHRKRRSLNLFCCGGETGIWIFKKSVKSEQGECLLKIYSKKGLIFFWCSCHSPILNYFRNINGILQSIASFGLKFSIPEWTTTIPVNIYLRLFQRFETEISILRDSVSIKTTANLENASRLGLYDFVFWLQYPIKVSKSSKTTVYFYRSIFTSGVIFPRMG